MPDYAEILSVPQNYPHDEAYMFNTEDNGPIMTRPPCRMFHAVVQGADDHKEQVDRWWAAREWCADQFGIPGLVWSYQKYGYIILFSTESAAFSFKMRWC